MNFARAMLADSAAMNSPLTIWTAILVIAYILWSLSELAVIWEPRFVHGAKILLVLVVGMIIYALLSHGHL